jgi:hypothetical protein
MAGNISGNLVEENLSAAPDFAALQAITDPRVTVTKILKVGNNRIDEQLIINGKKGLTLDEIIALQDKLPTMANAGPGNYRFQVTDDNSPAKVLWKVRLGVTPEENAGGSHVSNQPNVVRSVVVAPAPVSEDTVNMGNGWFYTKSMQTLTSPAGEIHSWKPGQPMPKIDNTSSSNANMTPISALPSFGGPSPETQALQAQIQAMQVQLAESQRQALEARDQAKDLKQQQELERVRAEAKEQTNAVLVQMQALQAAMTAKPQEDAGLLAIKRELEETRRMDALRADFNAKLEALQSIIREASSSKGPDPMVTLLMQMMQQQAAAATENLRVVREAATAQATMANANAMTPDKLMTLMDRMKEGSGLSEKVMESMGSAFDQVIRMSSMAREMSGGGDQGGGLMSILEKVSTQAGSAFQNYMQYKANLAAAEGAKARATEMQTRVTAVQKQRQVVQAAAQIAAVPAPSLAEAYEARLGVTPVATPTVVPASETQVLSPDGTDVVSIAEDAPNEDDGENETDATDDNESIQEEHAFNPLVAAKITELREAFQGIPDEIFFGPVFPYVAELRNTIKKYGTQDVAEFILQARDQMLVQKDKIELPQCIELLGWGQYEYMVERLLPKVGAKSRTAIVAKLKNMIEAENTTDTVA